MEPFGRTPFSLMGMNMFKLFFSFSGRINRARFWAVIAFWLLVRVGVPYLLYTFALLPGQSLDIQDASASPESFLARSRRQFVVCTTLTQAAFGPYCSLFRALNSLPTWSLGLSALNAAQTVTASIPWAKTISISPVTRKCG